MIKTDARSIFHCARASVAVYLVLFILNPLYIPILNLLIHVINRAEINVSSNIRICSNCGIIKEKPDRHTGARADEEEGWKEIE